MYIEDSTATTHYAVLGLDPSASDAQIKSAYRERLLSTHPDKTGVKSTSGDVVVRLKEAYRILTDADSRADYEITLNKTIQRQGYIPTGDGLDTYTLDDFVIVETPENVMWRRECPRCQSPLSIELSETALEKYGTSDGRGGYEIIVQCSDCSLWIKVEYEEEAEEQTDDESGDESAALSGNTGKLTS